MFEEALETLSICGFDKLRRNEGKSLEVFYDEYHSRIRNKSAVNIIFSDYIVLEEVTCLEHPERSIAKLTLTDALVNKDLQLVKKLLVYRKCAKHMDRDHLRKHVYRITKSAY